MIAPRRSCYFEIFGQKLIAYQAFKPSFVNYWKFRFSPIWLTLYWNVFCENSKNNWEYIIECTRDHCMHTFHEFIGAMQELKIRRHSESTFEDIRNPSSQWHIAATIMWNFGRKIWHHMRKCRTKGNNI